MYYDTSTPDRKHQIINFQDRYFHHRNILQHDRVCKDNSETHKIRNVEFKE